MTGSSSKKIEQRSCVVCRKRGDKAGLLRITCDADGKLRFDKGGKGQGRGAYVHPDPQCLVKAANPRIWQHVMKKKGVDKGSISSALEDISKFLTK